MDKTFSINHPILYIFAGLAIFAVILQSVVFLVRAWKRALELGYTKEQLKKIVSSSAIFTIAPAVAIGIGIITLSKSLGIALPWLRLSVVGAITYELTAAATAAEAMGTTLTSGLTAQQFANIAWVMTVGIAIGLILVPAFCQKTTQSIHNVGEKDKVWGEHFSNALFFGLVATFVGIGVSGVTVNAAGKVKALVLLTSAIIMVICGILKKKFNWNWLNDYAVPICMILSIAAAIPFTAWIH